MPSSFPKTSQPSAANLTSAIGKAKSCAANTGNALGWASGAAARAKLAVPDRQVICSIGDGSVMYSVAGFWTQARSEIPVLTVVSNNRNYQTARGDYYRYGGKMAQQNQYTGMQGIS